MRKESTTIQKCNSRLTALGLNSDAAFHRSKLILKIYRDVVWVLSERAEELQETAWIMGEQDIESGLCYLENFAPDIELQAFEEKVCCLVQNQKLYKVPPSEERLSLCERFSSFEPLCTVTKHFFC